MRLLEIKSPGEFSLTKDLIDNIPLYAILSHTWGEDEEEVTFNDLVTGASNRKIGHRKIQFCAEQTARDGLQYFWVDTCCINKSNNTELSEAINSMFRWYQNAARCYVYLSDVSTSDEKQNNLTFQSWEQAFRKSRWFTRGWTLQELIAPPCVEFFCSKGNRLGDKNSLEQHIHEITGIAAKAFQGTPLSEFGVIERMSWAENRETRREEDKAYSLLGIFDIHMALIYGEGVKSAFRRLREEIDKPLKSALPNLEIYTILTVVLVSVWRKTPLSTVPFNRDPDFVGRQDILTALESKFSQRESHKRVVLVGLGGVGYTFSPYSLYYLTTAQEISNCYRIFVSASGS
jgi:hypothetical protein